MRKNNSVFYYIFIAVSLIIIGSSMAVMFKSINKRSQSEAVSKANYSSDVNKNYVDNLFSDALDNLKIIANCVEDVDVNDSKELSKRLMVNSSYFSEISFVDNKGIRRYGKSMYSQFAESPAFINAMKGKASIDDGVSIDSDNRCQISMFAPVMNKGKVKGVLIGSVLQSKLNNLFDMNVMNDAVGMCVIDLSGNYICGSNSFFGKAGSSNSNYFSFVKNVELLDDHVDAYMMKEIIKNGNDFEVRYKKSGKTNIMVGQVIKTNKWYVVSDINEAFANSSGKVISVKNIILFILLFADFVLIIGSIVFLVNNRYKDRALIDKIEALVKVEGAILFEYNFNPKSFSIFLSYGKFPVTDKKRFLGECVYDVFDYVHEDDMSIRSRLRKFFESGETLFSSELRIKNLNGEYAWYEWYKITGTVIRDKEGNNISFVGKLTDADKQIAEEKNLVQRAENDLLTGVFNKKTMEEKITKLLEDRKTDRYYIFFMVDLDNFKNVNDTLGHIYGDKAICDTANALSEIFKTNAVVGRLGGDEFAVCAIYDSFDEESLSQYIAKKAEQIRKANLRSYTDGASRVDISSSIGISVSPNDGTDFQSLYKNADMALYESKKSGKNKYTRFSI